MKLCRGIYYLEWEHQISFPDIIKQTARISVLKFDFNLFCSFYQSFILHKPAKCSVFSPYNDVISECSIFSSIYGLYITITKTCLYNFDPLKPHFYIVKLGFTVVYIIFLISAQKQRLWVLVGTASPRRF